MCTLHQCAAVWFTVKSEVRFEVSAGCNFDTFRSFDSTCLGKFNSECQVCLHSWPKSRFICSGIVFINSDMFVACSVIFTTCLSMSTMVPDMTLMKLPTSAMSINQSISVVEANSSEGYTHQARLMTPPVPLHVTFPSIITYRHYVGCKIVTKGGRYCQTLKIESITMCLGIQCSIWWQDEE